MLRVGQWSAFVVPVFIALAQLDMPEPFLEGPETGRSTPSLRSPAREVDGTPDQKPDLAQGQPADVWDDSLGNRATPEEGMEEATMEEGSRIQQLKADVEALGHDLRTVTDERGTHNAQDIPMRIDRLATEIRKELSQIRDRLGALSALQGENQQQLDDIQDRLIWLWGVAGGLGFIAAGGALRSLQRHRLRKRRERRARDDVPEVRSEQKGQSRLFPEPHKATPPPSSPLLKLLHQEAFGGPMKDAQVLLAELTDAAQRCTGLDKPVRRPQAQWGLACGTMRGHIRPKNEDYALAVEVGDAQLLVMADGCGGTAHGQVASYLSCLAATVSLMRCLGPGRSVTYLMRERLVERAFHAAWRALQNNGNRLGIREARDGLRTTLIVVVGLRDSYLWGYIGDGGVVVLRSAAIIERILVPQRADPAIANVLAASMGPSPEGLPMFGSTPRRPGDLLLAGTDGVFDYVPASFPKEVMRAVINAEGNLDLVVTQVLSELADTRDPMGYICEDNLTLALMMNGERPVLGPGYWSEPLTTVSRRTTMLSEAQP